MPEDLIERDEAPQAVSRGRGRPRKRGRKPKAGTNATGTDTGSPSSPLVVIRITPGYLQPKNESTQDEDSWMDEVEYRTATQSSDFPVGYSEFQLPATMEVNTSTSNPLTSNREAVDVQVEYVGNMSREDRNQYYSVPGAQPPPKNLSCSCWHHDEEGWQSHGQCEVKPNFTSQWALYDALKQKKKVTDGNTA